MYPKKMDEMIGMTFNYLTVLEARPDNLKSMVKVRCVCGKEFITRGRSVKTNVTKSCGCKRSEYTKRGPRYEDQNCAFNGTYSSYKIRAKNKGLEFNLSEEEFKKLTQSDCYFCDTPPENKASKHGYEFIYNGIDRIDNNYGYVTGNIVPCCRDCNTEKGSISVKMIKKLYELVKDIQ